MKQNKSLLPHYFKARLRDNLFRERRMLLVFMILQAAGLPVLSVAVRILSGLAYKEQGPLSMYMYLTVPVYLMAFGAATAGGIVAAYRSFIYLNRKTLTDTHLALPVSTGQRFAADYISGLLIYTVPYIPAALSSYLILSTSEAYIRRVTVDSASDAINALFILNPHLSMSLSVFPVIMIMLYTFTVLAVICSGKLSASLLNTLFLNLSVPAFVRSVSLTVFSGAEGVHPETEAAFLMSVLSPAGGLLYIRDFFIPFSARTCAAWIICSLAVSAVLVFVSRKLYAGRKAEDTGRAFITPALYYLSAALTAFSAAAAARSLASHGIVFSAATGAVTFIIFWLIMNRRSVNISGIPAAAALLAVSCGMFAGLSTAAERTENFGAGKYIPDTGKIREVTVNSMYNGRISPEFPQMDFTFSDEEGIRSARELHSSLVGTQKLYKSGLYGINQANISSYNLAFTYRLKGGRTVTRYYSCTDTESEKLNKIIYSNQNVKKDSADRFEDCIRNSLWTSSLNNFYLKVRVYREARTFTTFRLYRNDETEELFCRLADAYRKDLYAAEYTDFETEMSCRYAVQYPYDFIVFRPNSFPSVYEVLDDAARYFTEPELF